MNRVMRSTVVLAAALGAISCKGDPTDSLRNGIDHLVANPSVLFIGAPDSTQSVLIEAVDDQGNRLSGTFAFVSATAGLSVVEDDSFNFVYNSNGQLARPKNWTRARFNVTTVSASGFESAVFSAGGKQITVPVRLVAATVPAFTLSTAAANAGDTVIATAPANFRFTPASVATGTGGVLVGLGNSADSSTTSFIVGPSLNGPVTITGLGLQYAPTVKTYSATSGGTLTTPPVTSFPATYSSATPAVSDTVVLSATGFKFLPNATVTFGARAATIIAIAADSSTISFVPFPTPSSTSNTAVVANIVLSFLPTVSLTLPATGAFTVPAQLSGTGAFGTAPTLLVPGSGSSNLQVDAGAFVNDPTCTGDLGGPCRIYKIVLAAPADVTMDLTWQGTTDLGMYLYDSTFTLDGTLTCDGKGAGVTGQPESCTAVIPAGTWYFVMDSFAPFYSAPNNVDPTDITIKLVGN